jgi:putative glutamine amidotransferase
MTTNPVPLRIGILGPEESVTEESRGCALWATGYAAALTAAGAVPVPLGETFGNRAWSEVLSDIQGVIWTGRLRPLLPPTSAENRLCNWCRKNTMPLLAVDDALLALNVVFGGTIHLELAVERPEALQHRHPPERGLRHAINILPGTQLADIYGEGELVVNSEHRRAVSKPARGFRISATALDGITEAIEAESERWFTVGVQWRPASASANGLDIQLFRGLLAAAERRQLQGRPKRDRVACHTAA